jgi:hypothetical protein
MATGKNSRKSEDIDELFLLQSIKEQEQSKEQEQPGEQEQPKKREQSGEQQPASPAEKQEEKAFMFAPGNGTADVAGIMSSITMSDLT